MVKPDGGRCRGGYCAIGAFPAYSAGFFFRGQLKHSTRYITTHSNKKGKFEMFLLFVQVFLILISFDVEWLLTDLAPRPELLIMCI